MSTLTTYNEYIKTAIGDTIPQTINNDLPANWDAVDARTAKWNRAGIAAPTPNDDVNTYYSIFSLWFYDSKVWICTDASSAAAVWIQIYPATTSRVYNEVPTGTLDGNNLEFGLAHTPTTDSLALFLDGRRMKNGADDDFTLSGSTITFDSDWTSTLVSGAKILADYSY